MKRKFIDIEPTWSNLLNVVERGGLKPEVLRPACELADDIRQAQKKGAKSMRLTFTKEGKVKLKKVI
jgi:hypothetical protein